MTANTPDPSIALTDAIQAGSAFAFEEAFKLHRARVYAYFLRKTENAEDAMDLMQNTFTRLWQYRRSLSREFLLEQHLFHIARTVFIDHLRRESKKNKVRGVVLEKMTARDETAVAEPEYDLTDRLERALSLIPALRRKVFYLNRIEGYSYREIADHLSITVKAADNHLTKAVRQLRKVFVLVFLVFFH